MGTAHTSLLSKPGERCCSTLHDSTAAWTGCQPCLTRVSLIASTGSIQTGLSPPASQHPASHMCTLTGTPAVAAGRREAPWRLTPIPTRAPVTLWSWAPSIQGKPAGTCGTCGKLELGSCASSYRTDVIGFTETRKRTSSVPASTPCSTTVTAQLNEVAALQCPPGLQPASRRRIEDTVAPFVQDWVFGREQVSRASGTGCCYCSPSIAHTPAFCPGADGWLGAGQTRHSHLCCS